MLIDVIVKLICKKNKTTRKQETRELIDLNRRNNATKKKTPILIIINFERFLS
jgi:hypothetical protein